MQHLQRIQKHITSYIIQFINSSPAKHLNVDPRLGHKNHPMPSVRSGFAPNELYKHFYVLKLVLPPFRWATLWILDSGWTPLLVSNRQCEDGTLKKDQEHPI